MGAPIGNKFWEHRSRHGRKKLFETPELMWEAATEYFEWIENNPLNEIDYRGKDADKVILPHTRPFTIHGLCLYLDCNVQYFKTFKAQLPKNEIDFNTVITRIEQTIYKQKFEGAATGFYNANIIARDLGLTDKKDLTTDGAPVSISVNVQDKALQDKLNKE